jgi:hypothetical protein
MQQTVAHRLTERRIGVLGHVERTGVLRIPRNAADPASVAHWAWPDGTHMQVGADLSWLARKKVLVPATANYYRVAEPYRDLVR